MPRRPPLHITITGSVGRRFHRPLHRLLHKAAAHAPSRLRQLTVVLTGKQRMSELHRQFMNDPAVTDVLTFPMELDSRSRPISGEVYICLPVARRMAKQHGVSPQHELLLYALHGLLHLSGFDDRTAQDFRRMHRREDHILKELGIGPVFAASPGHRPRRGATQL